jgi:ribosomal subunit interface protein
VIRAEATDSDLYCAVDEVVSKLSKQLRKFKTKLKNKGTETIRFENIDDSSIEPPKESLISRRKKFEFTPMSEEEAVLQLELVGHDFFVFVNSDTDAINVIYKRKEGDYGIIEQE